MNYIKSVKLFVFLVLLLLLSAGCGFKTMSSTETGVIYKKLPGRLGGYKGKVNPGSMTVYFPLVTEVYVLDTGVKSIRWPSMEKKVQVTHALNTRALDGNEVWLYLTVQYYLDPEKLDIVLCNVGYDDEKVAELVSSYSRSKIRAALGELLTDSFYDNKLRFEKAGLAKDLLNKSLNQYGIIIDAVILDDHQFDDDYQNKINETKTTEQQAQEKKNAIETMRAQKKKELQDTIATFNQQIADANGKAQQAKLRGDAYYTSCEANAKAIMIEGQNKVAAIKKQIEALQKQGGESLVKLQIANALQAEFYMISQGSGQGALNLSKVDYNEVLKQLGKLNLAEENATQPTQKK